MSYARITQEHICDTLAKVQVYLSQARNELYKDGVKLTDLASSHAQIAQAEGLVSHLLEVCSEYPDAHMALADAERVLSDNSPL